jgi:8-oxo-dGTP diphosphatase
VTGGFHGAKAALFLGDQIVTLLRDDKPGLPWAAMWDLPGGGVEEGESPLQAIIRETWEEVGLHVTAGDIALRQDWPSASRADLNSAFFVIRLPADRAADLRLGDEGQEIALMEPAAFLAHPQAIPFLKLRLIRAMETLQIAGVSP